MKGPGFDERELLELIAEVLEGEPDDSNCERLHEILESSRQARQFYRKHLDLHAQLDFDYTGGFGLEGMPGESQQGKVLQQGSWWRISTLAAGFVAALLLISLLLFSSGTEKRLQVAPDGVAVLSRALNVEWKHEDRSFQEGDPLQKGRLELVSGIVEVEFFSGASVILEGPADLELITEKLAVCHQGRLRVFVPEPAKGFTVSAPGFDAVDIGTEFAMSVSPSGTSEIHVIDGSVDLHQKGGGILRQLQAGDAARQEKSLSTLESISAQGEQFVDWQQLLEMEGKYSESRYQDWLRYREKWMEDPDTILYFDFEEHALWDRQLRNARTGNPNGGIIGARWVRGRWLEKSALEFSRATDRVRLEVPGSWDSISFAAWIRVDNLDRPHNALFLCDDWNEGEIHWHIGEQGQLTFAINSVGRKRSEPLLEKSALGRWIHLAVTYDSLQQRISHYLNGKLVDSGQTRTRNPLVIGGAELGNWKAHSKKTTELRSFSGRMDEFLILGRVMTPGEIGEHYDVGNPYR